MMNTPNTLKSLEATPAYAARHLQRDYTLYRMDGWGQRFYYEIAQDESTQSVLWYPSITSVQKSVYPLSPAIIAKMMQMGPDAWGKYLNNKAAFGTFWHMLAAEYLMEGEIDLSNLEQRIDAYAAGDANATDTSWWYEQAWKGMLSWIAFCKEHEVIPELIESPLRFRNDAFAFAGTLDLYCTLKLKDKRIRAIIDWKSGDIWDEYACQLKLQELALVQNFEVEQPISLFNWTWTDWRTKPGWSLVDQTNSPHAKTAHHALAVHRLTQPLKPKGMRVPDTEAPWSVSVDPAKMWRVVDIDEIVLERHK